MTNSYNNYKEQSDLKCCLNCEHCEGYIDSLHCGLTEWELISATGICDKFKLLDEEER